MNNDKVNVLVIDDEETIVNTFKAHFRHYYNVFTALNTEEGIKIIEDNNIQIVLCDYNMPGKDGILFFSELVLKHPDISRILITAQDALKIAIEAINFGSIYRYVHKPWDVDELKDVIDQSYEYYRLKKENKKLMDRLMSNDRLIKILEERKLNS